MHLDVRLHPGEDADEVAAAVTKRGGREYPSPWGVLPWRLYTDPSDNEFCVLPASTQRVAAVGRQRPALSSTRRRIRERASPTTAR
jgi:hypothetical protein